LKFRCGLRAWYVHTQTPTTVLGTSGRGNGGWFWNPNGL
jgi:hypothetical protein